MKAISHISISLVEVEISSLAGFGLSQSRSSWSRSRLSMHEMRGMWEVALSSD